jgi:hypothetical protein
MRRCIPFLALLLAACDTSPVLWKDPVPIARPGSAARLVVDSTGTARYVIDSLKLAGTPPAAASCARSLATAMGTTRAFAVWWAVRKDSSANLVVSSSPDSGRTWGPAVSVDTTDISSNGCDRPPPAVTAVGDDVYVAYSMIAPEGKGVFFAHFMGGMLHSPVPVIYGERLVKTAIAADTYRVTVAYEEPNGARERVDLALSVTQGHIFEVHTVASRDVDVATDPSVAFAGPGPVVAVGWTERRADGEATGSVVRVGRFKPQ